MGGTTGYSNHFHARQQMQQPQSSRREDVDQNRRAERPSESHGDATLSSTASPSSSSSSDCQQGLRSSQNDSPQPNSSQTPSAVTELDPRGLPTGWEIRVAPNGRVFFLDHNMQKTTWTDPRTGKPSPVGDLIGRPDADELRPLPDGREERFQDNGGTRFNDPTNLGTLWEDPRLENRKLARPAVLYSVEYKRKCELFRSQLPRPPSIPCEDRRKLSVMRSRIFEDTYKHIAGVTRSELLRRKLHVTFIDEQAFDLGGPTKEFFHLLSKEMFNPDYGLFKYSSTDNKLEVNPMSGVINESHVSYFKFIGRVTGMAVYQGHMLEACFIQPFYKMMLGEKISLEDMGSVDAVYFSSLKWIQKNDPQVLEERFCVCEDFLGRTETRELKPGGASQDVTQDNKQEYIDLLVDWRLVSRIQPQMTAFLEGFNEVVPLPLLKVFNVNELEFLMCGVGNIDLQDWRENTVYEGGYHSRHHVILRFWRLVASLDNEMRARLLQFVTGCSRLPIHGFSELQGQVGRQPFTIRMWGKDRYLPRSHTCVNTLDLPPYKSYNKLQEKVIKAIKECESFGGIDLA